jgi:hypothetical protein
VRGAFRAARGEPTEPAPMPTRAHREVMQLLDELLGLVPANSGPMSIVMRSFKTMRPKLMADFARSNPEPVVLWLHQLGRRLSALPVSDMMLTAAPESGDVSRETLHPSGEAAESDAGIPPG